MSRNNGFKARQRVFNLHKGICYYCGKPTRLLQFGKNMPKGPAPDDMATVEHLFDRWHPYRNVPEVNGKRRVVLSCYKCNQQRNSESIKMERDEQRRRHLGEERALQYLHAELYRIYRWAF